MKWDSTPIRKIRENGFTKSWEQKASKFCGFLLIACDLRNPIRFRLVLLRRDLPSSDYGTAGESPWQASDDPPFLTSGVTRRRRKLWRGKQVRVAPGIERGDTARFPQC
jgi:hypothetical protein